MADRPRSLRVLYFGTYERDYPRNAQVISALRDAGVDVFERHAGVWEGRRDNWAARWGAAIRLFFAEVRLRFAPRVPFDAVDRRALRKPDLVVADTEANADFLAELGDIPRSRVRVCLVGAEDRLFHAGWRPDEPFRVLFVGKLIPLHGVETILEAARLAPEIPVRIIGSGQLNHVMEDHPPNVEWVHWITYEDLPREYWGAGCALGIFGTSDKAQRVIPNKAYQALACGTPLITAGTRGARELLTDSENALLVPPANPTALADAMRRVAGNPELARRLGAAGRQVYEERASEDVLGPRWRALIEELL